ncbi:Uu.00g082300.m01.CDS01 [Anthostomella pinea]|uniref:Uu.00g082300.m01.CDS01 n=1 Tax=Anthostomella pinea TaxID=933095 RepID=A0AAI8VLC5_9PEZI|nr:Uu.00g082300.m01.CDS01 [Anthostomella pinea]
MAEFADYFASLSPTEKEAALDGPALEPPDNVVSNFDSPPNRNQLCFTVVTIGLIISTVFILIRAYARVFCIKKVHIGDGLIFAALSVYLGSNFAGSSLMCIRSAILLDWIRIFVPLKTRNAFFWTSHVLLWVIILFYGSEKVAENLACIPRQSIWDPTVRGRCMDKKLIILATSCLDLVADMIILALPQMVIWKLHLSKSKKLGISLIFAIGILNCVVAIIRIVTSVRYLSAEDSTYDVGTVILAGHAEMVLLFVVACVPAVPNALSGLGCLHTIGSSLKSWTKQSHRSRQTTHSGTGTTSVAKNGDKNMKPSAYEQLDGYSPDPVIGIWGVQGVTSHEFGHRYLGPRT